jgi:Xaa-Pro aminopeptidase
VEEVLRGRIAKAQGLMRRARVDLLALSFGSNLRYLSGFSDEPSERLLLLLLPAEREPVFLVPELYADQVRRDSSIADLRVWKDEENPHALLARAIADLEIAEGSVAIDDSMWAVFLLALQEALPAATFSPASQILVPLRMEKAPPEIRAMEEAGAIADRAFEEVLKRRIAGMSELDLARALEEAMMAHGADKSAFETLVASGPNSALPHHRAGSRRIEPGDVVIVDYGCRVRGYSSDVSRTLVCERATDRIKNVHALVRAAQEKAVASVRPGLAAEAVDRAARSVIAAAGFGERFIHRTGHGIGLDVHEPPYIVEGNRIELRPGMTFSVEPGIYLRGEWGVRIEDVVVVTETGAQPMTHSTHELKVVG